MEDRWLVTHRGAGSSNSAPQQRGVLISDWKESQAMR